MRNKRYNHLFRLLFLAASCFSFQEKCAGQIFPGLEGEDLVTAIQSSYTPQLLLDDTQVKDTLYARIFNQEDTVRCIYSGLPRFLPEFVDPSQYLFGSGNEMESVNMEHGWPQAKGAGDGTSGNMNMHHLYPSRAAINSDRGNFPFLEINDNIVQKWYLLELEMSVIPVQNIHAYSEFAPGSFEPRESVKGDIARAMFYFWTIYRDDAVAADPDFFNLQVDHLCAWQEEDPVDAFEWWRNEQIAIYQDGKINPFIADCSLAKRAYCTQLIECATTKTEDGSKTISKLEYDQVQNQFHINSEHNSKWKLCIVNLPGQVMYAEEIEPMQWSKSVNLVAGSYIAFAINGAEIVLTRFYIP